MNLRHLSQLPSDIPTTLGPVRRRPASDASYLQWLDNSIFESWRGNQHPCDVCDPVQTQQEPEPAPAESPITEAQIINALREVKLKHGLDTARMIIRIHGRVEKAMEIPTDRYREVLAVANCWISKKRTPWTNTTSFSAS